MSRLLSCTTILRLDGLIITQTLPLYQQHNYLTATLLLTFLSLSISHCSNSLMIIRTRRLTLLTTPTSHPPASTTHSQTTVVARPPYDFLETSRPPVPWLAQTSTNSRARKLHKCLRARGPPTPPSQQRAPGLNLGSELTSAAVRPIGRVSVGG